MLIIFIIILVIPITVNAGRGCCSSHGGVASCGSNGKQLCRDGTYSPSCRCTPPVTYKYGCTDSDAKNYDPSADKDNGSCKYYVYGCMDKNAKNYNSKAEKSDGSCKYYKSGCTDKNAKNYDSTAEKDDNSCVYYVYGCTDVEAKNYNVNAEIDDGTCEYYKYGCMDDTAKNYDPSAEKDDNSCEYEVVLTKEEKEVKNKENVDTSDGVSGTDVLITVGTIATGAYIYNKKKKK